MLPNEFINSDRKSHPNRDNIVQNVWRDKLICDDSVPTAIIINYRNNRSVDVIILDMVQ